MSIKSAQAKQQLRNSDGTFANENKNAGFPSNDMIQRASKLLAKSSATVDEPIIKPSVKSEGYMGSTAITGGKYDASRSPAENAKLMRADIKALQKNGQLPKDWKIGVRTSTGSASWRARFTIQLPEGESSTYVPTHAEYMAADSEDRIIGPEHRAGRGIIEAHGGSASSDEWDETARRINQKIQNNEQLTVEEQACVIETPKVRNAKKLCQQVGDQYTYQNNNAMVDYFDTDGYVTVQAVTGIKKPENIDILPRMNAGDSRTSRFGFLFDTTKQEGRGR